MAKDNKASKKPATVTKVNGSDVPPNILLHQLILRNVDRAQKDVGEWRLAHRMAEAVLNPTRRRLYDLFADVELDGHLSGVWKKRVSAVVNKKMYFSRDGERDTSFDALLNSKAFRRLRKKRMEEQSHGVVGFEFIPGDEFAWNEIPRKHIKPYNKLITIEQDGNTGFEYDKLPNVIVCEGEEPFGFLLKAAPYALFKKGNYSDWAQYVEIFGQPVIITKYDGYDEKTRILLDQALTNAGSSLRLMLPKQADFEVKDGKTSNGDGKLQETFKNALNNELSILVLGNTETTSNDNGGSLAKGKVHAAQQLEITKDDLAEELIFFNDKQWLNVLKTLYGFNTDGVEVMYETEVDSSELKASLDVDEKLEKIGIPLDHDYYYKTYHRPKPENYDELMAQKETQRKAIANQPPAPVDDMPEDEEVEEEDDDANTPDNTGNKKVPAKKKAATKKTGLQAALKGLSTWEKFKAVFWEAR